MRACMHVCAVCVLCVCACVCRIDTHIHVHALFKMMYKYKNTATNIILTMPFKKSKTFTVKPLKFTNHCRKWKYVVDLTENTDK